MLAARIAHRTTPRILTPRYRSLSLATPSRTDLLRGAQRPAVSPRRIENGSRSLSLWWGQSKPAPATSSASSSVPDTPPAPQLEPEPETALTNNSADTSSTIELTQAEPNVLTDELVSSTSSALDTLSSTPATHQLGDFAAQGFASSWPSGLVQSTLELIHVQTGLPWWASIVLLTALVRTAVLPLNLRLMGNASRLARVQPQFTALTEQVKRAREVGDSAALQHVGYQAQKLMKEANASPFKGLLGPLVQMPIALSFFFGIRNICNAKLATLQQGGFGWFTDLTVADPTWALPIMSSVSMLILLETSAIEAGQGAASHTRNFFRALAIITIPVVSYLPSGVLIYFITNGAFMLIQTGLSKIPAVRRAYGILDKPAPPPGAKIVKPPTFMDSLRALRDGVKEAAQKARDQQEQEARSRARAGAQKRR
ncbi:Mitochondrial inner membrane protein oxa1l [Ceratobasidium sp. 392]|nr:Mitochondrial inner membrane protein oxa1l [Ceratobasidium sp. 392]